MSSRRREQRIGKRHSADWAAILLGTGLGLTVALEIESMSMSDWKGVYPTITSISRLAALIGSYFALVGLVLIARIPWIEKSVGHDKLVRWHRKLGPWSLYLIFFHVFLVGLGYAGGDRVSTGVELWRMTIKYPWMIEADIAFALMIAAGITSYKKARAKMSYETWWTIHIMTYGAVALGFMHQVLTGPMFIGHPLNKYFWLGLYVVAGAVIGIWRIAIPFFRSVSRGLVVDHVTVEGPNIVSVIMRGRRLESLNAQGGQFFSWRFLQRGHFLVSHPYSLSAAPQQNYMRITIKGLGDHSADVINLKPGTRVFFEGPYGVFVADKSHTRHVTLIGGGVGITPLRALLDEIDLTKDVDVLYRVSDESELIFRKELDAIADHRGARIHYLVGSRKTHPMTAPYIAKYAPAFKDSEVYVCGPTPLVDRVFQSAKDAGIPKDRVHTEEFEFHAI